MTRYLLYVHCMTSGMISVTITKWKNKDVGFITLKKLAKAQNTDAYHIKKRISDGNRSKIQQIIGGQHC